MVERKLGIVVLNVKISQKIVSRFIGSIRKDTKSNIEYQIVSLNQNTNKFNNKSLQLGQIFNQGIRSLQAKCDVIVCSSVDLIVPPGFLDLTYEFSKNNFHFQGMPRDIVDTKILSRDWDKWRNLPLKNDIGSWNAMSVQNWLKIGMWNDELVNWKNLKNDLFKRIRQKNLSTIQYTISPLMHVMHNNRFKTGKSNAIYRRK